MKKILCIFLVFAVCLFSCTAGKVLNYNGVGVIQAYADDESNSEDDDEGFFEGISNALSSIADTIGEVVDAIVSLVSSNTNLAAPLIANWFDTFFTSLTALWSGIMDDVVADELFSSNTLYGSGHLVANIATILSLTAVGIWSIGVALELKNEIKRSEDGEFTLERFTSALARSFPSLVFILASYWICKCIVYINEGMVSRVADLFPSMDEFFDTWRLSYDTYEIFGQGAGLGYMGYLADLLMGLVNVLPIFISVIVLIVIGWCVNIKLKMRQIEVSCMIAVSPLFFACAGFESLSEYFKKFIMTFISVVIQTLFMAIVILIGMTWFNDEVADMVNNGETIFNIGGDRTIGDYFADIFIFIAMGIMLLKPPSVLQNLVKA